MNLLHININIKYVTQSQRANIKTLPQSWNGLLVVLEVVPKETKIKGKQPVAGKRTDAK